MSIAEHPVVEIEPAIIRTRAGRVRGAVSDGVHVFKGIPYAAPPFGADRLRPPQPVEAWDGVRDALAWGAEPPQLKPPADHPAAAIAWDPAEPGEDCLNLNVWTPDPGAAGLPVMVWIPGGMFEVGIGRLVRRQPLRPRRRRLRDHQLPRRGRGLPVPRRRRRQPRAARPDRRARVGARQHRRLRRRPGQRHHLRRVGRRDEHRDPARHAPRRRAVPPRHRAERRRAPRHPGRDRAARSAATSRRDSASRPRRDGDRRRPPERLLVAAGGAEGRPDGRPGPGALGPRGGGELAAVAAGHRRRRHPRPADRPHRGRRQSRRRRHGRQQHRRLAAVPRRSPAPSTGSPTRS